jgi:hypothetical protein
MFEYQTVTLTQDQYPMLHALLRKKLWISARSAHLWSDYRLSWQLN